MSDIENLKSKKLKNMNLFKWRKTKDSKARAVYFKIYSIYELPVAMIGFTSKDKNDVIQLGQALHISFYDTHEMNIRKMMKIEKTKGFMFWDASEEGEKFYRDNKNTLNGILVKMVMDKYY